MAFAYKSCTEEEGARACEHGVELITASSSITMRQSVLWMMPDGFILTLQELNNGVYIAKSQTYKVSMLPGLVNAPALGVFPGM